jgi:uncharacterized protein YeaO (DUF488 family)
MIRLKRAYDSPEPGDGARILVDRLWPRGIKKQELKMDAWLKEVAPSDELRKWFGHDPEKWEQFRECYSAELKDKDAILEPIRRAAQEGTVTLLYSAKDTEHNQAVALKAYLEK